MDHITVKVYGLTPKTKYSISYKNSSNPGAINSALREEESDESGFLTFSAEKHSDKIQIELSGNRVIDLEE